MVGFGAQHPQAGAQEVVVKVLVPHPHPYAGADTGM